MCVCGYSVKLASINCSHVDNELQQLATQVAGFLDRLEMHTEVSKLFCCAASYIIRYCTFTMFHCYKTIRLPFYRRQTTREGIFAPVTLTLAR